MREPERSAASTMTTPTEMPEMMRLRRGKSRARGFPGHRHFADVRAASFDDLVGEGNVLGRVGAVEAAGKHGDGARGERRLVRGGVDAARQTGGDD